MKKFIYLTAMMAAVQGAAGASFDPKRDCPKLQGQSLAGHQVGGEFNDGEVLWVIVRTPSVGSRDNQTIGKLLMPTRAIDYGTQLPGKSQVLCTYGKKGSLSSEFVIKSTNHPAALVLNERDRQHKAMIQSPAYAGRGPDANIGPFKASDHCPSPANVLRGQRWDMLAAAQTFEHNGLIWTLMDKDGPAPRALDNLVVDDAASRVLPMGVKCFYSQGSSQLNLTAFNHPNLQVWKPQRR